MKILVCDTGKLVGLLVDKNHIIYISTAPDNPISPELIGKPQVFQMCTECRIVGDTEEVLSVPV